MADKIAELKGKLAQLEELGVKAGTPAYDKVAAELAKLTGGAAPIASGSVDIPGMTDEVSQEEYAKSSSKFPAKGLHLAEFQGVFPEKPGQSLKFTFVLTGEGDPDAGKEDKIATAVTAEKAMWKWKPIWAALGIPEIKKQNGNIDIGAMMNQVAGKKALVLFREFRDTRTEEEGGKGTVYTKPTDVYPLGTRIEDIA